MSDPDNDEAQRTKGHRITLEVIGAVALAVAGVLLLQIAPPPPNADPWLFIGNGCLYYGGFAAIVAAVLILLVRLPKLLADYRHHT